MASSLERLLGIRAMQEELARRQAEAERARLRELERLAAEAAGEARASRERWFAAVERESQRESEGESAEAASAGRLAEESAWEQAVWRRARLERLGPAQRAELERAQEEYLGLRRERRQVESLVETARNLERAHAAREDQRRVDDWFHSRSKGEESMATGSEPAAPEGAGLIGDGGKPDGGKLDGGWRPPS